MYLNTGELVIITLAALGGECLVLYITCSHRSEPQKKIMFKQENSQ